MDLSSLNKRLNKTGLKEGDYQIVILDKQLEDRKVSKEDNLLELQRDIKKLVTKSKSDSALKHKYLQIKNKEQQIVNRLSLSPKSIRVKLDNGDAIVTNEVISYHQPIIINILNKHSCSSGKLCFCRRFLVPGMAIGGNSGLILGITGGRSIDVGMTLAKKNIYAKKQQALQQQAQNRLNKHPS